MACELFLGSKLTSPRSNGKYLNVMDETDITSDPSLPLLLQHFGIVEKTLASKSVLTKKLLWYITHFFNTSPLPDMTSDEIIMTATVLINKSSLGILTQEKQKQHNKVSLIRNKNLHLPRVSVCSIAHCVTVFSSKFFWKTSFATQYHWRRLSPGLTLLGKVVLTLRKNFSMFWGIFQA